MDILRIKVYVRQTVSVPHTAGETILLPFDGTCEGPLFTGKILPGGTDVQQLSSYHRCTLCARYALEGVDADGQPCRMYIENTAVSLPDTRLVTHPSIRTNSSALRWLETADLSGRIEEGCDHLEIVITCNDTPSVKHLALRRGGLTIRGRLDKKTSDPCPLVMMLHGFGGDMSTAEDSWFQHLCSMLTDAGLAVLRLDFNGHGCSDGDFRGMTIYNEIEDAAAYLQYALDRDDITNIYLLGHSQGGVVAGMLAGYYHDIVSRLVLLAPASALKAHARQGICMQATYDPQHIPAWVNVDGRHEVGGLYFRIAQTLPIDEVTRQFHGKSMVVAAGQDEILPLEQVLHYADILPNCRAMVKPSLNHGLCGAEHEQTLQEVVRFLTE